MPQDMHLTRQILENSKRVEELELGEFIDGVEWLEEWNPDLIYTKNQMVRDDVGLFIANIQTVDRPFPQPVGNPGTILPIPPPFITLTSTNVITSGVQITDADNTFLISELIVTLPDVAATTLYRTIIRNLETGQDIIGSIFSGAVLSVPGDFEVPNFPGVIIAPTSRYQFLLSAYNSSSTTQFVGGWTYSETNAEEIPSSGEAIRRGNRTNIRFSKFDDLGADREANLLSVIPNTNITSTGGADYNVVFVVDGVGFVEYEIEGDDPATLGLQTFTFDVPIPDSTSYSQITNHWLTPFPGATLQGVFALDDDALAADDNAYGVNFTFQEYKQSSAWDIMALSSLGGIGGVSGGVGLSPIDRLGMVINTFENVPGLVGLWPMSSVQRSTGNVGDASGNVVKQHLTHNGDPKFKIYNDLVPYIALDGTGDFLDRPDEADLSITGAETHNASEVQGLTIGGWFRLKALPANAINNIAIGKNLSLGGWAIWIFIGDTTNWRFNISNGVSAPEIVRPNVLDVWTFLAGVFDPTNNLIKFWVDDVVTTSSAAGITTLVNNATAFTIGNFLNLDTTFGFLSANALPDEYILDVLFKTSQPLFGAEK